MRPLETQVEMSSHLWMFNRVKELLAREGLIVRDSSDEDVRIAVSQWMDMVTEAKKNEANLRH